MNGFQDPSKGRTTMHEGRRQSSPTGRGGAMIHHASTGAELGRADLIAGAPTAVKYQILENAGGTVDA